MKVTVARIAFKNIDERYGEQEFVCSLDEYQQLSPDSTFEMTRDQIIEHAPDGTNIVVAEKVILSTKTVNHHPVVDICEKVQKSGKWLVKK